MNPHLCRIALRPRSVLESFDLALRLMRRHWPRYAMLTLVIVVPAIAVLLAMWSVSQEDARWGLILATLVTAPLLQGPFTVLTGRLLFADDVTVRAVIREVRGRLGGLLQAWLAQLVALFVGLCSGVFWIVTVPVTAYVLETALLERVGVQQMLNRSSYLAWKHFGVAMAATLGGYFLTAWAAFVGELGGQQLVGFVLQLGEPFGSLFGGLLLTPYVLIGMVLVQPIVATYRLLLYVDVRTRVEGWDLQVSLRAAGLGSTLPEEAA